MGIPELPVADSAGGVYRVCRSGVDAFAPAPWPHAVRGRYDDPRIKQVGYADPASAGCFRVIYLGESRVVAFREVLQGFRPRPDLLFKLRTKTSGADPEDIAIDIAAGYVVHEGVLRGIVHREWRAVRRIAHIYIHLHPCVDLFDPAAWSYLSYVPEIQELAHDLKIDSIDLSSLTSGNRQLTQGISRHI
jgi:hypothetical protein